MRLEGINRKSINDPLWKTPSQKFLHIPDTGQGACGVPAYPWHRSRCLRGICISLTLAEVPAGHLHISDTYQKAYRVPTYPWHLSKCLQGTCISRTPVRMPAGYLHIQDTTQNAYRVPAYPWHLSGFLQGTCISRTLVRMSAGYLHIPDTSQDACRVPAGYLHIPDAGPAYAGTREYPASTLARRRKKRLYVTQEDIASSPSGEDVHGRAQLTVQCQVRVQIKSPRINSTGVLTESLRSDVTCPTSWCIKEIIIIGRIVLQKGENYHF